MTPAPTTISRFGTWLSESAPVELTMRCSSISTPRSGATSEPVAMTIAAASTVCCVPSAPATCTLPGPAMLPMPGKVSILFFLNRKATPEVFASTTLAL